MRVLAIDPGYDRCGVAVIERATAVTETLLYSTCITTDSNDHFEKRLRVVGESIKKTIKEFSPNVLATEKTFFTKNQKTALEVSHARGVILYEAALANLPVFEYTPPEIKVAVTGYGASTKEQIMSMVPKLINIQKEIKHDDEFDAIAVGLTHLAHHKMAL